MVAAALARHRRVGRVMPLAQRDIGGDAHGGIVRGGPGPAHASSALRDRAQLQPIVNHIRPALAIPSRLSAVRTHAPIPHFPRR